MLEKGRFLFFFPRQKKKRKKKNTIPLQTSWHLHLWFNNNRRIGLKEEIKTALGKLCREVTLCADVNFKKATFFCLFVFSMSSNKRMNLNELDEYSLRYLKTCLFSKAYHRGDQIQSGYVHLYLRFIPALNRNHYLEI